METDKLTITIDSTATGTLLKIVRGEGEVVPITETIAIVGEAGTDVSAFNAAPAAVAAPVVEAAGNNVPVQAAAAAAPAVKRAPGERVFSTPRARMRAEEKSIDINAVAGSGPDGLIIEKDVLNTTVAAVKATPVAKVIAEQNGVDLAEVKGTGANGKIMKADVMDVLSKSAFVPAEVSAHEETVIPMTGMRRAIANNMMTSLTSMAQANHRMKVDMSESVRFRAKLKAADIKVSYTDILIKAVSHALMKFPMLNSTVRGNDIITRNYVNMGVAVAIDGGLIVPNIKDAQAKSVVEIHAQVADLAGKAKEGKLTREEYTDGTFTITNLGMYDVDEFTAVINPPEAAILAVGKIADTPVVENGEIVVRPIMTLSLTYDHRIIDGAPAAQFLQYVKTLLQNPYLMM
jgi:pyruvate dehydrogenase E2 component (dihydrolipoamide acetyltransferase)